jgi:hypothetical protein
LVCNRGRRATVIKDIQMTPLFPEFKTLELSDRRIISELLHSYHPLTSELTFTNLFIWRDYFGWEWSIMEERLICIGKDERGGAFALPPIGPPSRAGVTRAVLSHLERERSAQRPAVERADRRLVEELAASGDFVIEEAREHFDYVYASADLVTLAGRKYHSKRNFINHFRMEYDFIYEPIEPSHISACLDLSDRWCRARRCEDDQGLMGEWGAVREALENFRELELLGGAIVIDDKVQAFTLGEALNEDTAVIHVEKADPDIRGLYAVINQQFCEHALAGFSYINREQDLGDEGLRKAKESYFPERMEQKYRVALK